MLGDRFGLAVTAFRFISPPPPPRPRPDRTHSQSHLHVGAHRPPVVVVIVLYITLRYAIQYFKVALTPPAHMLWTPPNNARLTPQLKQVPITAHHLIFSQVAHDIPRTWSSNTRAVRPLAWQKRIAHGHRERLSREELEVNLQRLSPPHNALDASEEQLTRHALVVRLLDDRDIIERLVAVVGVVCMLCALSLVFALRLPRLTHTATGMLGRLLLLTLGELGPASAPGFVHHRIVACARAPSTRQCSHFERVWRVG